MFRYTIIAVGKMKRRELASLCDDFASRLRRQGTFELVELKDSDRETEGERILAALDKRTDARVYALTEEGRARRSLDLADELGALQGQPAVFIVGGPFGLSDDVKRRSHHLLSLSRMTFTHEIARMLLLEQLYRAVAIQSGSKYRHE